MVQLEEREQERLESAWRRLEQAAEDSTRRSRERRARRGPLRRLVAAVRRRR